MHLSKTTLFKISYGIVIAVANYLFFALLSWDLNPHYWNWWAIVLFLIIAWSWFGLLVTAEDRTKMRVASVRLINAKLFNKSQLYTRGWGVLQKQWSMLEFKRMYFRRYNPFRQ